MIYELPKSNFYKCEGLLNEQGQLEPKAVIAGVNPGRIFVDNLVSPMSGLIWLGNNNGFIFIGNESNEQFNNEVNDLIDDVITPESKKIGLKWFEGIGNHREWNQSIEKMFEHRKLGSWSQRVYKLQKGDYKDNCDPTIEQDYVVQKISKLLYENTNNSIRNIEFLHSKILEFWSSSERFFYEGIGYCIVNNQEIVSVCFSGFVFENIHCIDIETLEFHRGKKLAQKVAHCFVKDCFENDWIPYWDCMEGNEPSVRLAEGIGFSNILTYEGYQFSFE